MALTPSTLRRSSRLGSGTQPFANQGSQSEAAIAMRMTLDECGMP